MSRRRINKGCVIDYIYGLPVLDRHDYAKGRDSFIEHFVAQSVHTAFQYFKAGGRVLDVGTAYGYAVNLFNELGYDAEGIDLHPDKDVFKKLKLKKMDFYKMAQFYGNAMDGIFVNHVLEHAGCAMALIEQIWRSLKVGGHVFVAVPYVLDEWAYDWQDSTTHFSHFTEKTLESMFKRYGFKTLYLGLEELKTNQGVVRKPQRREVWYVGQKGRIIDKQYQAWIERAKIVKHCK